MNRLVNIFVLLCVLVSIPTISHAAVMYANKTDATVRTDGKLLLNNNWTLRVGENNAPNAGCAVFAFKLPDTLDDQSSFALANFRIQLASISGRVNKFNLDLYALKRTSSNPTVLASDYYAGSRDNTAALIQDDFMSSVTPKRSKKNPYINTNDNADIKLTTFLVNTWDHGSNAGKYIFLRLSPDLFPMPSGNNAFNIVSSNAGRADERPCLTYNHDEADQASPFTVATQIVEGNLQLSENQIQHKGSADVQYKDERIHLVINDPHHDSGLRITPPDNKTYWDLSTWEILAVDVENLSSEVQMRLLMQMTAGGPSKDAVKDAKVGLALNPHEKRTLRIAIPHKWKYETPKGPRGPRVIDSTKISRIEFFVQWPFENAKKDLVNCVLTNLRVEKYIKPAVQIAAEDFFPFVDVYGQYTHEDWQQKIKSESDLLANYQKEQDQLDQSKRPAQWNPYGGWVNGPQLDATGYFRTEKYQGKWYFVDPDGRLFWSHGIDVLSKYNDGMKVKEREDWFESVPVDTQTYYPTEVCLQVKYGIKNYHPKYYTNLNKRLKSWGFNSIGNWSRHELIEQGVTPYTLQLTDYNWSMPRIKGSKLKFYDVWDQRYIQRMKTLIPDQIAKRPLVLKSLTDPMCMGYFIDNELNFGNRGKMILVDEILKSPATQASKQTFMGNLKVKYLTIEKLNIVWGTSYAGWKAMEESIEVPDSEGYRDDAKVFFHKTVDQYFRLCREAIKSIAPHRLYLGTRFVGTDSVRKVLYEASEKYCDVLTVNIYSHSAVNFPVEKYPDMPVLIGEFHFGISGVNGRGMFSPGLCSVGITQQERAMAYLRFMQGVLVHPNFVGAHWFQYRDQPITGRGDGEAYQIGFVDVADTPYEEMCQQARLVGENIYRYRTNGKLVNKMTGY